MFPYRLAYTVSDVLPPVDVCHRDECNKVGLDNTCDNDSLTCSGLRRGKLKSPSDIRSSICNGMDVLDFDRYHFCIGTPETLDIEESLSWIITNRYPITKQKTAVILSPFPSSNKMRVVDVGTNTVLGHTDVLLCQRSMETPDLVYLFPERS